MSFTFWDVECIVIYLLLVCCVIGGGKIRGQKIEAKSLSLLAVDKTTSDVMKAIACVFVLIGHWGTYLYNSGKTLGIITKISWYTTANIALCWFMFFSGYGLSLKDNARISIGGEWWKRVKKIYIPLLVVCLCTMVVCAILPDIGLEKTWFGFTKNIYMLHNFDVCHIKPLLMNALGLFDWYVSCILIFYLIFYLTLYLSRKFNINHTILLGIGLLIYNVMAFYVFGYEQAHYFRYPWVFMLGHLVAVYKRNPKIVNMLMICAFFPTILIHDKVMITCFVIAVIGLLFFAAISRKYELRSKPLLFLGSISYFFYLCHGRIGNTLLAYTGIKSMLLWIVITIIVSIYLMKFYCSLFGNRKV